MEEILYYLAVATGISFLWLLLAGHRPQGERPIVGLAHLVAIVGTTGLLFLLWRRELGLAVILAYLQGLLTISLWAALPNWNTRGHTFLAAFTAAQVVFLARIAWAILFGRLALPAILASLILFLAEFLAVLLTVYFAYEVLDVMCRIRWRRLFLPFTGPNDYWPKVSIHVPAHAEPTEMVIETLSALHKLDYPNYEVIMVDDNTNEDELWRPVLDFCHQAGFKVFHLQNYPGFKSGALNFALSQTAPDAEIVVVVDADYVVEPNFLRETVPYFHNPRVAFVQTPQSFRNSDDNLFARRSTLAQRFFFEISMRSRNEYNAIIFCGTMGLIRKRALERIGGWDEWCITEDAEASLRLLSRGYQSIYINRAFGHGLLPTTFESTKKQRFRWAFGGMQILRRYWRQLMPWTEQPAGLTRRQRLAYLMGLLSWVNDLLVLIFTGFLLLTSAAFALGYSLPVRQLAEWILLVPVLSIVTGMLRVAWAMRLATGCSWREGFGAFTTMLALSWTVAQACLSALRHDKGVFLRTPKFAVQSDLTRALRAASWETILGIALVAAAPIVLYVRTNREGILLAALLAWHALIYLSALRSALVEVLPVQPHRPERAPSGSQI
ncbi:MAG: glycosyltransferase [Chloroflexi bacterium]|nr:glycosyltransferase [Chloroflexota bacterium]MCI0580266.1 glycosyltransferase [Chloroflexota bacterium]MCI0643677.1 glycosyltransferase [Chloroflexota bacterium]MCI0729061.1 glycosyltransferase [Chloroflexota bacterium]